MTLASEFNPVTVAKNIVAAYALYADRLERKKSQKPQQPKVQGATP